MGGFLNGLGVIALVVTLVIIMAAILRRRREFFRVALVWGIGGFALIVIGGALSQQSNNGYRGGVYSDMTPMAAPSQERAAVKPPTPKPPTPQQLAEQHAQAQRAAAERRQAQRIANHDKRAAIQAYWNPVINQLGIAQAGLNFAIVAVGNGDLPGASGLISKASDIAGQAVDAATSNEPDGFDEIGQTLQASALHFKSALDDLHDYLDDQKPSTGAKAQEEAQEARDAAALAVQVVRQKYIDLGGSSSDIEDVQQAGADATKMMAVLTGN